MATLIKADDLFAAWSRGQYKSVYLFAGAEDFLIDEALEKLVAKWLPEAGDINYERLDADDVSAGQIIQASQTVPFASDYRLIVVRNIHLLSPDDQKQLSLALPKLLPTTRLVLLWSKEWKREDGNKALIEAAQAAGAAVIFWPLYPEQAQRWAVQRARLYKKTLSLEASQWLVEEAGVSLRRLDQELVKASQYVGARTEISREDLEEGFGYKAERSPFEWITAVRQKKYTNSMRTLRQLLEDDEEPLKLLAIATYSVRDWVKGEERREGDLAFCVEAHQSIKTGKETPSMALTLLTLRLCGLQTVDAVG